MKVIVFGTGGYYRERKAEIESNAEIVAFIDNNTEIQGTYIDSKLVAAPEDVHQFVFDTVLLMSTKAREMKRQLLDSGMDGEKIWYWRRFLGEMYHGTFRLYCGNDEIDHGRKRVLILSTDLDYNGGTLAAVYAALALQDKGYSVMLAAPEGNQEFIDEAKEMGINIAICPALPYLHREELFWVQHFDVVLVNVFQMVLCACEISRIRPVIWWIHEPRELYEDLICQFDREISLERLSKIPIYAVSNIAQKNFSQYFPDMIKDTLVYGIPDTNSAGAAEKKRDGFVFAVIGGVMERKAQDIFIRAAQRIDGEDKRDVQFWIIGSIGEDRYSDEIRELVSHDMSFRIWGNLPRSEIQKRYGEIDVVVCPSREEPMSIAVTEGMMYGKACIVSKSVGMAAYIEDGENGMICEEESTMSLCEKMVWAIRNRGSIQAMGIQARQAYEKYFSMEHFGERLERALFREHENGTT